MPQHSQVLQRHRQRGPLGGPALCRSLANREAEGCGRSSADPRSLPPRHSSPAWGVAALQHQAQHLAATEHWPPPSCLPSSTPGQLGQRPTSTLQLCLQRTPSSSRAWLPVGYGSRRLHQASWPSINSMLSVRHPDVLSAPRMQHQLVNRKTLG